MKITYDKKSDALYIEFTEGEFKKNVEVMEGVILDIGQKDTLLGIEILEASSRFSLADLAKLEILMPLEAVEKG